jgi:hypothetical protein
MTLCVHSSFQKISRYLPLPYGRPRLYFPAFPKALLTHKDTLETLEMADRQDTESHHTHHCAQGTLKDLEGFTCLSHLQLNFRALSGMSKRFQPISLPAGIEHLTFSVEIHNWAWIAKLVDLERSCSSALPVLKIVVVSLPSTMRGRTITPDMFKELRLLFEEQNIRMQFKVRNGLE